MINWREINEKFPKAFWEYIRSEDIVTSEEKVLRFHSTDTGDSTYFFTTELDYMFCISADEVIKLPFYFDTFGILILPDAEIYKYGFKCIIIVSNSEGFYLRDENGKMVTFDDRLSATVAGATRAFEIRESQLNNKQ